MHIALNSNFTHKLPYRPQLPFLASLLLMLLLSPTQTCRKRFTLRPYVRQ